MKVLVIDDEFEAREAIKGMLAGLDLDIIYVADAVSALLCLKDNKDVKVVITDYRMPGLGGKDWIDLLNHYHPAIDIIVITGYEIAMNVLEEKQVKKLKKPFDKYKLLEAMGCNLV